MCWTECSFKWLPNTNLESQIEQLCGFVLPWASLLCVFKPILWEKLSLQIVHLNTLFLSWTASICFFLSLFIKKYSLQILHWYGFFPSWTVAMYLFSSPLLSNAKLHVLNWVLLQMTSLYKSRVTNWTTMYVVLFCHEKVYYVPLNQFYEKNFPCKWNTWTHSFHHELLQYAFSFHYL